MAQNVVDLTDPNNVSAASHFIIGDAHLYVENFMPNKFLVVAY